MQVRIESRSGKSLATLELPDDALISDLQKEFHRLQPKYTPARQWFTYGSDDAGNKNAKGVHLDTGRTLKSYGIEDGDVILFKDLGPQIGWQTVFLIEYAGPFFIHPLYYYLGSTYYGMKYTPLQVLFTWLMAIHFGKRLLETLFVHRFSHATMPMFNVFKNSFHYWVLSGVLLAAEVYSPWYTRQIYHQGQVDQTWQWVVVGVWTWAQLSNLSTHLTLRNLRPPGTRQRAIPYGYGFSAPFNLSCPNYFFESIAWMCVVVLTRSWMSGVFLGAAVGQMWLWAVKKHRGYKKEFKDYPRNRRAMFPIMG